ncbi:MAG: glucose-6-phosphate isomerase [Clostridiales bacterium]|nr:MAG: glucose-6-phosphate isomerase [Clostridiales bacterium]
MAVKLETRHLKNFIGENEYTSIQPFVNTAHELLTNKTGLGNDFLGWVDLPYNYDKEEFARIKIAAEKIISDSDVLLVIGIGGSYLGSRAVIEAVKSPLYNSLKKKTPEIYFLGNSISSTYFEEVLELCEGKDVSVNVISKSGTTTEPALAFRIAKDFMEKKYGANAKKRIYATTDKARGTLKDLATKEGYETFVVPDDVGGRYSVLTAVGLLPIACSGIDIDKLMQGAQKAHSDFANPDLSTNDCYKFAAIRNILLRKGKSTEITVAHEPGMMMFSEWIKQLMGESEGKDGKGLFPAGMIFSTDLHSLGQYVQQGQRNMFETVIWIKNAKKNITVTANESDADGLNFLAGKTMQNVSEKAYLGTILAHVNGGVPNVVIEVDDMDEFSMGYLIYFYEKACGISAYLLGVNPFDQPGVQMYKANMFALLGKPGYEDKKAELEKML